MRRKQTHLNLTEKEFFLLHKLREPIRNLSNLHACFKSEDLSSSKNVTQLIEHVQSNSKKLVEAYQLLVRSAKHL